MAGSDATVDWPLVATEQPKLHPASPFPVIKHLKL
jgi:hypothetical protein